MGEEGKSIFSIVKKTFKSWSVDDAFTNSASIAFYSILSLPGLVFLVVYFAGLFLGKRVVEAEMVDQISALLGPEIAGFVQVVINNSLNSTQSSVALYVGLAILTLSATAVFIELQKVLNRIWKVRLRRSMEVGIKTLIFHRLISLGLILFIGILFLVSIISASSITMMEHWITNVVPDKFSLYIIYGISSLFLFSILSIFFALIYKFMPDAKVEWKPVRVGSLITTSLFLVGAIGLKYYFSMINPTSTYGVAGSVVLILIWAYYSSMVFLLGAEFTKVYAITFTDGIIPTKYSKSAPQC